MAEPRPVDPVVIGPLAAGSRVLVAGAGVTGQSVLRVLEPLGVRADLTDDRVSVLQSSAFSGVRVIDAESAAGHVADYELVVTSPGPNPPYQALTSTAGYNVRKGR